MEAHEHAISILEILLLSNGPNISKLNKYSTNKRRAKKTWISISLYSETHTIMKKKISSLFHILTATIAINILLLPLLACLFFYHALSSINHPVCTYGDALNSRAPHTHEKKILSKIIFIQIFSQIKNDEMEQKKENSNSSYMKVFHYYDSPFIPHAHAPHTALWLHIFVQK